MIPRYKLNNRCNFRKLCVFLLCLFAVNVSFSQSANNQSEEESPAHIQLKTAIYKDSVSLRWAVDKPLEWQKANKIGFVLKRYTVVRDGKALPTPEEKQLGIFQPASQDVWEASIDKNDNAAIVAQSLFGESFEVDMGENKGGDNTIANIVNKSQELEQRFAYALMAADMDYEVAKMAGWGYTDKMTFPKERYLYVVELNSANNTENVQVEKGTAIADASTMMDLPKPLSFIGIFQDKSVTLTWEYRQLGNFYTMYYVEKSIDGVNFEPINDIPLVNMNNSPGMMYVDSLRENNANYSYRIRGKNIFGKYGPYSDVISGKGKKKLETAPRITSYNIKNDQSIVLNWEFSKEAEKDITGFELLFSETDKEKSYKTVKTDIPASSRQLVTESFSPTNYFKIKAVGKAGDSRESFASMVQPNDTTPPAIPIELKGEIDTLGVVHLHWKPDTEKDLEGYHVFRATQKGAEPVRLTPQSIQTAVFTDTVPLKSLNSKVYYCVLAVDKRKNESDLCPVIEIEKPDKVNPKTPVFSDYSLENGTITLKWTRSYSDDVAIHRLYRQSVNEKDTTWQVVFETKEIEDEYTFVDKKVEEDKRYKYYVQAEDKHGLKSDHSQEITLRASSTGPKHVITTLVSYVNKDKKRIDLNWKVKNGDDVVEIVVYRNEAGKKPTMWNTLNGAQNFLEDKDVEEGMEYTYLLKAMLKSNKPTATEKIVVKYQ